MCTTLLTRTGSGPSRSPQHRLNVVPTSETLAQRPGGAGPALLIIAFHGGISHPPRDSSVCPTRDVCVDRKIIFTGSALFWLLSSCRFCSHSSGQMFQPTFTINLVTDFALQSRKALSARLCSEQILPFGFARWYCWLVNRRLSLTETNALNVTDP